MANDEAIGFSINIPEKVFGDLEKVDKAIKSLQATAENTAKAVSNSFLSMASGVNPFIDAIKKANDSISNLSGGALTAISSSMNATSSSAATMAGQIVHVTETINKLGTSGKNIVELKQRIEELNQQLTSGTGVPLDKQQALVDERNALKEELKLQNQSTDEYIKNKEREAEAAERATKRKVNAYESELKKQTLAKNTTYEGAMSFSSSANSIDEEMKAVKYLTAARNNLSKTDANYDNKLKELNNTIKQHKKNIQEATSAANLQNSAQRKLMDVAGQLTRRLALVFSVSQVIGYINKLVDVRAEFELQTRSLEALLQNKDKADRLFSQITSLAIKSPFTIKELTTYTKQLAAYQIESEKLYDTTKRLADVSAGLGVDMSRLILAYGQVKAANVLKGTELRQFSEAGLNVLGELADYYSELEGRMVSVGEVQAMVTKKMVSFADVEEVFRRVTEAGGLFYNMQEIQADTLRGMLSNLQDSFDLMLNQIGSDNEGIIKGFVSVLKELLDNWEDVLGFIKQAGIAFLGYKAYVLLTSDSLTNFIVKQGVANAQMVAGATNGQRLKLAFQSLNSSIMSSAKSLTSFGKGGLYGIAASLIIGAITDIIGSFMALKEAEREIQREHDNTRGSLIRLADEYEKAKDGVDGYSKKLSALKKLKDTLEGKGYQLPTPIELATPENIDEIFKGGTDLLNYANDLGTEVGIELAQGLEAAEVRFLGVSLIGDNLKRDLNQLQDSYSNLGHAFSSSAEDLENTILSVNEDKLSQYQKQLDGYYKTLEEYKKRQEEVGGYKVQIKNVEGLIKQYETLIGTTKEYVQLITDGQKPGEKDLDFNRRRIDIIGKAASNLGLLNDLYSEFSANYYRLSGYVSDVDKKEAEVSSEIDKRTGGLAGKYGGLKKLQEKINKNPFVLFVEVEAQLRDEKVDITSPDVINFVKNEISKDVKIPIAVQPVIKMEQIYGDFRDTIKALDPLKEIFSDQELQSITDLVELQDALSKKMNALNDAQEVYNQANTKRLNLEKEIAEAKEKSLSTDAEESANAKQKLRVLQEQEDSINAFISEKQEEISTQKKIINLIAQSFNLMLKMNTASGRGNNIWKDRVNLIKRAYEAYKKYAKYYGEEQANKNVLQDFASEARQLQFYDIFSTITFDAQGAIDGLQKIIKEFGKSAQKEAETAITSITTEANIEVKEEDIKRVSDEISDLFDKFNLAKELKGLGVGSDTIKRLFGVEDFDYSQLRSFLEQMQDGVKDASGEMGTAYKDAFKQAYKDVADMQKKEYEEQLKTYLEYLNKTVSARAAAELAAQKAINEVRRNPNFTETEKDSIVDAINREKNQKLASIELEEFMDSSMYRQMFSDLENLSQAALERIQKSLLELREAAGNAFSPEDMESWMNAYDQINEAIISQSPFKILRESMKEIREMREQGITEDSLQEDLISYTKEEKYLKGEIADLQTIIALKKQGISLEQTEASFLERNKNIIGLSNEELQKRIQLKSQEMSSENVGTTEKEVLQQQIADINTILQLRQQGIELTVLDSSFLQRNNELIAQSVEELSKLSKDKGEKLNNVTKNIGITEDQLKTFVTARQALDASIQRIQQVKALIDAAYDSVTSVLEAAGVESDSIGMIFADMGMSLVDMTMQAVLFQLQLQAAQKEAEILGYSINAALGPIGWAIIAIQALSTILSSVFKAKDKSLQKQIDNIQDRVDKLQKTFEELEEDRAESTSISDDLDAYKAQQDNIKQQIASYKEMINLESQKKSADEDTIAGYNDEIDELIDKQKELREEFIAGYGGFGSVEAQKDAAQEFADSWLDAYKETGDGLSALNEKWDEYFDNIIAKQMMLKGFEKIMKPVMDYIDEALEDGEMTTQEWDEANMRADAAMENLNKFYQQMAEQYGIQAGTGSADLEGLSKGIQSITEETALALESILNSMRFFVSDSNMQLKSILAALVSQDVLQNPILGELKAQTTLIRSINDFFASVIGNGHPGFGGKFIKVAL